jgi:hypothetical protein
MRTLVARLSAARPAGEAALDSRILSTMFWLRHEIHEKVHEKLGMLMILHKIKWLGVRGITTKTL